MSNICGEDKTCPFVLKIRTKQARLDSASRGDHPYTGQCLHNMYALSSPSLHKPMAKYDLRVTTKAKDVSHGLVSKALLAWAEDETEDEERREATQHA